MFNYIIDLFHSFVYKYLSISLKNWVKIYTIIDDLSIENLKTVFFNKKIKLKKNFYIFITKNWVAASSSLKT